jgi:hypothetical protein
MGPVLCVPARTDHEDGATDELRENVMDDGRAPHGRASRWTLTVIAAVLAALPTAPTASAHPGTAVTTAARGVTVAAAVATGSFVDVFATSESPVLQVDGQDGRFPTTVMSHDPGSTRFYARVPVAAGQAVTTVTVSATQDVPPSTATADVRAISVTQASYDATALTVAASAGAPADYPLRVEAGGVVGELPSPAPVSFPLAAPPASITVSSGVASTTAPVVVTGGMAANTTARVAAAALTAPRGVATVIDGRGSTDATTFRTVIKSGPQGAVLVDDTTSTPKIVLPTWAAPTDILPRVAPAAAPTVVTFTASDGAASSSIDVTVTPVGDTVAVTTARSVAGAELRVDGTSTMPGVTVAPDPPTQVVVYARTSAVPEPTGTEPGWVKVGSAAVDPAGGFSVRPVPAPDVAYVQYLLQTSRGTLISGPLGG